MRQRRWMPWREPSSWTPGWCRLGTRKAWSRRSCSVRRRRARLISGRWRCYRRFSTPRWPWAICCAARGSPRRRCICWSSYCSPSLTRSTRWCCWGEPWRRTAGRSKPSPPSIACCATTPNTSPPISIAARPTHGCGASARRSRTGSGLLLSLRPDRSRRRRAPRHAPRASSPTFSSPRAADMAIQGPLRELGIHDVFQLLDLGRKTGALRITSALRQNEGTILFHEAAVVAAAIQSNPHPLGSALLRAGKSREEALARARALQGQGDGRRIGEILVATGSLSERDLKTQVRAHIDDVVFTMLGWSEGYFVFEECPPEIIPR